MIAIWSGEPGAGKTWNAMQCEEPIEYWDLEKKAKKTIKSHSDKLIELKDLKKLTKAYHDDFYKSYIELKKETDRFLALLPEELPATLVVDGITDIRNEYCKAKYLHDNPGLKQVGEQGWRVINPLVRDIVLPLINMATVHDFHLVFTAQFTDVYGAVTSQDEKGRDVRKSGKLRRGSSAKDWQGFKVFTLVELSTHKKKYYAEITKSPVGIDEFEITGLSLFDELINRGI